MREDTRTTTPEDAARFHYVHAPDDEPVDLPSCRDLIDTPSGRPYLPSITETVKSALVAARFDPRPLATLGTEGEASGVCVFVLRPADDTIALGQQFTNYGIEWKVIDGTVFARRRDPFRTDREAPIEGPYDGPPF